MRQVELSSVGWRAEALVARGFTERLFGVHRGPRGAALVIPARSVHGFGLDRPLEVVGVDRDMRVVAVRRLRPNRIVVIRSARWIVELPEGSATPAPGELIEVTR